MTLFIKKQSNDVNSFLAKKKMSALTAENSAAAGDRSTSAPLYNKKKKCNRDPKIIPLLLSIISDLTSGIAGGGT